MYIYLTVDSLRFNQAPIHKGRKAMIGAAAKHKAIMSNGFIILS